MKPLTPHNPLDDLIAAALHGELTPEERAQFESRLSNDPAARAAYQEAQAMHDLLEKTHKNAQPDPAFEQRMVSGVRRKLQTEEQRETTWESALALWKGVKGFVTRKRQPIPYLGSAFLLLFIVFMLAGVALGPITNGIKKAKQSSAMQQAHAEAVADYQAQIDAGNPNPVMKDWNPRAQQILADAEAGKRDEFDAEAVAKPLNGANTYTGATAVASGGALTLNAGQTTVTTTMLAPSGFHRPSVALPAFNVQAANVPAQPPQAAQKLAEIMELEKAVSLKKELADAGSVTAGRKMQQVVDQSAAMADAASAAPAASSPPAEVEAVPAAPIAKSDDDVASLQLEMSNSAHAAKLAPELAAKTGDVPSATPAPATPPAIDDRKLIRNAQLDLEVKSFQIAMDEITRLTRAAGGYVDTSNSQKGGNGKLQGTVVVKVLPQNLDDFLLKLRDLGEVQNQSVSTDDVTKDYFDTQARLVNSQKMETQLQDLLKRENGKVSDLLAVERELGRVRGDIEQMQGQLKLYDFQVQYATVTMQVREKDLNQAAAYLLKEQDDFSLFAADVEGTFQKARHAADDCKAQVLVANLVHNSSTDVAAELQVMVAPDQVETFLAQVRGLGRVANFTRQTQRIAKDGGNSDQPADQTLTDKDKVQVHVSIRSDNELRKEVLKEQDDFSLYATDVEDTFLKARQAADEFKAQVLAANLNHNSGSDVSAELQVLVPPDQIDAFLAQIRSLGRVANFTRQTQRVITGGTDNTQPVDETPTEKDKVQVHLAIRSDDETRKQVALTVVAKAVDTALDAAKAAALANAGTEILSSALNKTPEGQSTAQLSLRVPGKAFGSLIAAFNALGRTSSLSIQRNDNSGPGANGDDAPVIVTLSLTDDDAPLQETQVSVAASDVDEESQQIKKSAADAGVEVKASSFEHQPDGTELAQMTFRLPMAKYPAFLESVKGLGKVESLTVHRDDRPDETRTDDTAPAEISLQLHSQREIIADDDGLVATMRHTFAESTGTLFGCIRAIGVVLAFLVPWAFTLGLLAWVGRRIYIWRKK